MAAEAEAWALADASQSPESFRRLLTGLFKGRGGIVTSAGWTVAESGTPAMSVQVAAGAGLVLGTETSAQGLYYCQSTTSTTLSISAADATNPRYDLVVARIRDDEYSTGPTSAFSLEVLTGTAAASPADPTVPDNCWVLARVSVIANETEITNAEITDLRASYSGQEGRAAALGGISACTSTTRPTVGIAADDFVFESDTGFLMRYSGSAWAMVASTATAWTAPSLGNSWANFGGAYATCAYRKIGDIVYLRGLISSGTVGSTAFTLPTGYRPPLSTIYMVLSNNAVGRVDVNSDGTVVPGGTSSIGSNSFFSLNGITFSTSS